MVKLLVPPGVTSVSVKGKEFRVGRDRTVLVPDESVGILQEHGLTVEASHGEDKD